MSWLLLALLLAAPPPEDALEQAAAALQREDYQTAAPLLEGVLAEHPEQANLQFQLAFAYTRLERPAEAIERYEKAVELDPKMAPARLNLALLLLEADRPAGAAQQLQAVIELRPDDPQALYFLGHAERRLDRPAEAVPFLEKALALDPQPHVRLELGQALMALERWDGAAEQFREAATQLPEAASYQLELAERVEQAGDREKALGLYQAYAASQPDPEPALLEKIGFLLLDLDRAEEAIAPLEQVVAKSPSSANRAALSQAYSLAKKTEEALAQLAAAAAAAPDDVDLTMRYANALLAQQRFEQAGPLYLRASKLDPRRVEAYNGLAFCWYQLEQYPAALQALAESAKLAPESEGNLFLKAIMQDKLHLYELAEASYKAFLASGSASEDRVWQATQRLKLVERMANK